MPWQSCSADTYYPAAMQCNAMQRNAALSLHVLCCCRTFKAGHLAKHPYVEACCWDAPTTQQFRLRGPVTVIDASHPDASLQVSLHLAYPAASIYVVLGKVLPFDTYKKARLVQTQANLHQDLLACQCLDYGTLCLHLYTPA